MTASTSFIPGAHVFPGGAVDAGWWKPPAALADWQAGRIELIEPTVVSLRLLSGYRRTADRLAAIRAGAGVAGGRA